MAAEAGPLAAQIGELLAAAGRARASESAARDELTALRTRLAVVEEGARHRRTALQGARAQQARLAEQQGARAARLEALGAEIAHAAEGLEQARGDAAGWEQAGAELRGRLAAMQGALDAARDRQAEAEQAQRDAQGATLAAESAHGHSAVEQERRHGAAAQLRARVEEDLALGPAAEILAPAGAPEDGAGQTEFAPQPAPTDPWTLWTARWEAADPVRDPLHGPIGARASTACAGACAAWARLTRWPLTNTPPRSPGTASSRRSLPICARRPRACARLPPSSTGSCASGWPPPSRPWPRPS